MTLLRHYRLSEEQTDDIRLLIGEAVANAIRHSRKPSDVECTACLDSDHIRIQIINSSDGFSRDTSPRSDLAESGMGCDMIKELVLGLCSSELHAESKYGFDPREKKTIFKFSLRWKL